MQLTTHVLRRWFALAIACAISAACRHPRSPRPEVDRFRAADDAALASARRTNLPSVSDVALDAVRPRTRVVITTTGISIDDAARFADWSPEARRRIVAQLGDASIEAFPIRRDDVVSVTGGRIDASQLRGGESGFLIQPLDEVAREIARIERASVTAVGTADLDTQASLYADADSPMGVIVRAVYTLGQNAFERIALVVRTPAGERALRLDLPNARSPRIRQRLAQIDAAAASALAVAPDAGLADSRDRPNDGADTAAPSARGAVDGAAPSIPAGQAERATAAALAALSGSSENGTSPEPPIVTIRIEHGIYTVHVGGDALGADCAVDRGGHPAPLALQALHRCMVGLRNDVQWAAALRDVHTVTIAVDASTRYQSLIDAIVAARETRPGARDLFPEFELGIL